MAAAGALSLGVQRLGSRRRLLHDYLSSEGCDIASCEVPLAHYKSLARRSHWCEPEAAWSMGEADGIQMIALPIERNEESRLWRVAWRPDSWLTHEELVLDMQELHLGAGVVIVWPEAVKAECAIDAADHESRVEERLSRPIKDVIVIECACSD